jgi:hypothetical protein
MPAPFVALTQSIERTDHSAIQLACPISDLPTDEPVAFDGHLHRFAMIRPEIESVHISVPFNLNWKGRFHLCCAA